MGNDRELNIILRLKDEMSSALQAAGSKIDGLSKAAANSEQTFRSMRNTGAVAFAAIGGGALKAVTDFERFNDAIARAGAYINATEDELQMFRDAAIDAARGTAFSFEEAAAAIGNFVGGEIDAATASAELAEVLNFATVANIKDLQQAVNIAGLALTVFKDDVKEMTDVTDIMATVAADVTTETDAWATAIVNSAGAAKAAGFSFKELNILFAAMVRGGADVNLMWSAFNSAMSKIQGPASNQMISALTEVGLSVEGLTASLQGGPIDLLEYLRQGFEKANEAGKGFAFLTQVVGGQAAPEFALALGLTNDELRETAGYFEDIEGRGAEMAARIKDSQSATERLKQAMSELSITLGGALAPAWLAIVEAITPVVQKMAEWMKDHPKLTASLIVIAGAIAGIVTVVGILGLALPGIIAGFTALATVASVLAGAVLAITWPMVAIAAAIAGVVAAGVLLYKNWDTITEKFRNVMGAIKDFGDALLNLGRYLLGVVQDGDTLNDWLTHLPENFQGVAQSMGEFVETGKELFWGYVNFMIGLLATLLDHFVPGWDTMLKMLWDGAKAAWEGITAAVSEAVASITATVGTWFESFKQYWSNTWNDVKDVFVSIWESIQTVFDSVVDGITSAMSSLVAPIQRVIDLAQKALPLAGGIVKGAGVSISSTLADILARGAQITGKASGGPVQGNTPYIVGERGPELFVPNGGGSIVPNHALAGGGPSITVNIMGGYYLDRNAGAMIAETLGEEIRRRLRL